jgi:hypothetical protein
LSATDRTLLALLGQASMGSAATGGEESKIRGVPDPGRVRVIIDRYKNPPEGIG